MEKLIFDNGLTVLMEEEQNARTASFGIWARSGSIYEDRNNNGISHFIEHMLFKGTKTRSSMDIAEEMDFIGGQMNAYTTKEYTCFYARSLSEHMPKAFDIIADMIVNPKFDLNDIETERKVVQEEINMSQDMPDDRVVENQYKSVWQGFSVGMPILGTKTNLENITREDLINHMNTMYAADRLVIAICGNFNKDEFLDIVYKYFKDRKKSNLTYNLDVKYTKSKVIENDNQEQTHICLCMPAYNSFDIKRYALNILNIIAGGSTSSRLFQQIREKLGLAYTVFSSTVYYNHAGLFEVQTAVNPNCVKQAYDEILKVLEELSFGITEREFLRAREQLKSGILMSLESTSSKAAQMGRTQTLKGSVKNADEIVEDIMNVTIEDVNNVAKEIIDKSKFSISVVGPCNPDDFLI